LFGPELLKLVGIQKLTRLAWSSQLDNFLKDNKIGGEPLATKAGGWLKSAQPLWGVKAYEFHKVWVYFARMFGIQLAGTIEERPGIPPGPQHVKQVTQRIIAEKIPLILVEETDLILVVRNINLFKNREWYKLRTLVKASQGDFGVLNTILT